MTQTQMVDGRIERCRQMNDARRIDIISVERLKLPNGKRVAKYRLG